MNISAKDSLFYYKYACFSISYINFLPYIFYSDAKIQIFWRENGRGRKFFGRKDLTLNKSKALGLIRCRRENMYWPLRFFPEIPKWLEIEMIPKWLDSKIIGMVRRKIVTNLTKLKVSKDCWIKNETGFF